MCMGYFSTSECNFQRRKDIMLEPEQGFFYYFSLSETTLTLVTTITRT